jgi:predicted alpha/beta-fold hydrolase
MSPALAAAPSVFRPFPLLGNPHVQTLVGHFLRGLYRSPPAQRHVVQLPDGDALVLHDTIPPNWRPGDRIAVLIHGLTGCHASPAVVRLARRLLARGVRAVRLDLRGAGKGLALARRGYHAGASDDLRAALAEVHRWDPQSPLLVAGLSLGGNIALKMAGETAKHPVAGLARVAAIGPPIDVGRSADLLSLPRNRLYEAAFIRGLAAAARLRQHYFPDLPPLRLPSRLSLRLFDELYTAPRCGFAGAADYYRRASSFGLVGCITVPTFILTARDDPFVAAEPFDALRPPPAVEMHILSRGGHLGFLGPDGAGGIRWAERRLAEWLLTP